MFKKKVLLAIKYNGDKNINFNDIEIEINNFKESYSNLLIDPVWDDDLLNLRINEFDMLLSMYESMYSRISDHLYKNKLVIWENDKRSLYSITSVYLLRFLIQDLLCLRNLCAMKFEYQFNSIFRDITEKVNILFLYMFDYEFSSQIIFNDKNLGSKQLYESLLKPKKIRDRIKSNSETIKKTMLNNQRLYARSDLEAYNFISNSETLKSMYELSSLFTHTNNLKELLRYYNEGGKYNYSLKHNASNYLFYRLDYVIEFILLLYDHINRAYLSRGVSRDSSNIEKIRNGYFSVIIDEKYKK